VTKSDKAPSDGSFNVRSGNWTFTDPSSEKYLSQKGINLRWRETYGARSDGELYLPLKSLAAQMKRDAGALRRWQHLFAPRMSAASSLRSAQAPSLFPGHAMHIPASARDSKATESETAHDALPYHQFLKLQSICADPSHTDSNLSSDTPDSNGWPWSQIGEPEIVMLDLAPGLERNKPTRDHTELGAQIESIVATNVIGVDVMRHCLDRIHEAWAPESRSFAYDETILMVACEILSKQEAPPPNLISIFFELELFASYSTMLLNQISIGSGFYAGNWLDVLAVPISRLKATERCHAERILDEMKNLRDGKTAPVVINEYGCVADGNHRLTAAIVWNMLNRCQSATWALENDQFQKHIAQAASDLLDNGSIVALHEGLRCLGILLSDEGMKKSLMRLKKSIKEHSIESLPAVPILEYSSLAVVASLYETSGTLLRFLPRMYEILSEQNNLTLSARACYHFADHVPLPWFSVIPNAVTGG
jgi:hypothetical protein